MSEKRRDYISWDEYFYGCGNAYRHALKDPNTGRGVYCKRRP